MAGRGGGNVRVRIDGDVSGLKRSTRDAEHALDRLNTAGSKSMRALGAAAKVGGAALVGGLAVGFGKSAAAAIEAEKAHARVEAQLKALGTSYKEHSKAIDTAIAKTSQLSGLDDEDLLDSFTNIVRVTGDVNEALKLNGLAADFARAKHIDVAKAGEIVGKVAGGNTGILARYGISIDKGASSTEALGVLQQKFAGQAKAYGDTTAGSIDRAKVAAENLGETVGGALAPAIATGAGAISKFVTQMQTGEGAGGAFSNAMRTAFTAVKGAVQTALTAVRGFIRKHRDDLIAVGQAATNVAKAFQWAFETILLPVIKRVFPGIRQVVQGVIRVLGGLVDFVTGVLTGDWGRAWNGIKSIVSGVMKAIGGVIRAATAPIRAAAAAIAEAVKGTIGGAFRFLRDKIVVPVVDRILGAVSSVLRALGRFGSVIGKLVPGVGNLAKKAGEAADEIDTLRENIRGLPTKTKLTVEINSILRDPSKKLVPLSQLGKGGRSLKDMIFGGIGFKLPSLDSLLGSKGVSGVDSFTPIARRFGLMMTSGFRPGDDGWHGRNRARDYSDGYATPGELAFARFLATNYGSKLKELIHTPLGFGIDNGQRVGLGHWGAAVNADHYDHVHVAYRHGGKRSEKLRAPITMIEAGEEAPRFPEYFISTNPRDRDRSASLLREAARDVLGFARGGRRAGTGGTWSIDEDAVTLPDSISAAIALAALTPDNADDIAAGQQAVNFWQKLLNFAQSVGDQGAIAAFATQLGQAQSSVAGFQPDPVEATEENTEASADNTAALLAAKDALIALKDQLLANANLATAVSQSQYGALTTALVDLLGNGIGGRVGRTGPLVSAPGVVTRY